VNWDALGAIAELLGAGGVVVTLAYLAVQIRNSNRLTVAESQRFATSATATAVLAIAQDENLARVFRNGLSDRSSLNPDELVRFDMLMGTLIGAISSAVMDAIALGLLGDERFSAQTLNIRGFLSPPGGSAWWGLYAERYPVAFRDFVERELLAPRFPAA
jgi:hypothetical protein